MQFKNEEGQSIILVALAMSIFLIGAVGLGFDGSQLYEQRNLAQNAADAAAIAGVMSVFDGTAVSGGTGGFIAGTGFTCTSSSTSSPCVYAKKNGFSTASDTVAIDFPATSAFPGVTNFSSSDTYPLLRVQISRTVNTTLMRLLGATVTTVKATATAAIVNVQSPTPILVTDPWNSSTLTMNGNSGKITICGGPSRSIEVNSINSQAFSPGSGHVDLTKAGPLDSGNCSAGTGADFGVFGGPAAGSSAAGQVATGVGKYLQPASPIQDPLANVAAPTKPGVAGTKVTIHSPTDGCTFSNCDEYSPGTYSSLVPGNNNVIFKPGLYYVEGGGVKFKQTTGGGGAPNYSAMCVGCPSDANTGQGMLIYDTVPSGTAAYPASRPTGGFTIDTNVNMQFQGPTLTTLNSDGKTVPAGPYYGVVFWEDRTANANAHGLGQGNGCFSIIGTIYITNTQAIMAGDSTHTHFQSVSYNGNPCSTTINQGDIIVGQLHIIGATQIKMNLVPYGFLNVRQVALIN